MTTQAPDTLRLVPVCLDEAQQKAVEHAAMDAGAYSWRHCRLAMVDGDEIVGYPAFSRADLAELGRLYSEAPAVQPAAGREVLPTDEGGCVTKRFVIFNTPNRVPEKKGGWLKDEHLIDFLRDVVLHDGWEPGFRATVLELTWDNDLWASSASEYLSLHDHAIGPRAARKAWKAAREKRERIYKAAPAAKLGEEIESFRKRTAISTPAQASGEPVAWQSRIYDYKGEAGAWHPCDPPEDPTNLRPCRIIEYRPLYAHPPARASGAWVFNAPHLSSGLAAVAQASETGGEMLAHITQALLRADEEFGNSLSAYRYRKLAEAVAALSAPQAAPGEGERDWDDLSVFEKLSVMLRDWPQGALRMDADLLVNLLREAANELDPGEGEQS